MTEQHTAPPEPAPRRARGRQRGLLALVAAVVAVVLAAGGAFAAWQVFLGGGPRPAEVLPASTFALATVDLDPSGGQKVAAIKTLRTFPSWRKRTGVRADSDLMRSVFELLLGDGPCRTLDYDRDVRPWIGSRAAVGGVRLGEDTPAPVLTLQVTDRDEARSGFAEVARCAGAQEDLGWTVTEDYVVASDTAAHARAIVRAGQDSELAADPGYQKWTDEAGGAGVLGFYLAPDAPRLLSRMFAADLRELRGRLMGGLLGSFAGGMPGMPGGPGGPGGPDGPGTLPGDLATAAPRWFPTRIPTEVPTLDPQGGAEGPDAGGAGGPGPGSSVGAGQDGTDRTLRDFEGAAGVVRFADGGVELSIASSAAETDEDRPAVAERVEDLPADTAAVVALAVPPIALDGPGAAVLESLTGLDLPQDLETLLGESLTLTLGGRAPADLASVDGPGDLPLGARVRGDADEIERVVGKLEGRGPNGVGLHTQRSVEGDEVAVATSPEYAARLLTEAETDLGGDEGFGRSVRHLDEARALVYLDLDGDWGQRVTEKLSQQDDPGTQELAGDLAVVEGLGATAWSDGDVSRALVRLSVRE